MNFWAKTTYFVLSVCNTFAFLFGIKYSFDIYAIVDVPSVAALFILGLSIFFLFILFMLCQGLVFRAADTVNVKINNYQNIKFLRNNDEQKF